MEKGVAARRDWGGRGRWCRRGRISHSRRAPTRQAGAHSRSRLRRDPRPCATKVSCGSGRSSSHRRGSRHGLSPRAITALASEPPGVAFGRDVPIVLDLADPPRSTGRATISPSRSPGKPPASALPLGSSYYLFRSRAFSCRPKAAACARFPPPSRYPRTRRDTEGARSSGHTIVPASIGTLRAALNLPRRTASRPQERPSSHGCPGR